MQFFDDSLLPETQDPLVIQVAPYAPSFFPRDSDDIPLSYAEQVQKAVDCYNAGATVLHVHVREPDGNGSKDLDRFNEMLDRLRSAVPGMILQVGGSISFAPKGEGQEALWLSDDTRHMLADLNPAPDQVTLAVNTNQMNVMEIMSDSDVAGTSMDEPAYREAYTEMYYEAGPKFMKEHMKRLTASGIQTHFMVGCSRDLETVERLVRNGHYMGPLVINWVAIGGGHDGPNPRNLMEFINRLPQNAVFTVEGLMRNVYPLCTMGIAMGVHVRVGQEDNLWGRKGERATSVQQIEKMVRISEELYRPIATAADARRIYKIGTFYSSIDETLRENGWLPNRTPARPTDGLRIAA
ncbi:3-keto-5-aminohexanoate cleavage protein [Sphingomonas sp. SUN039]|uniref:3-keto-5-aminohexanoate cleavage protein n=1 Tax=Sphingomonas sp. SUN039 TaxID=2937787 RepID=UPI00216414F4|nr:3-keto-5-aminohexanoate cleavage protein [Sphingomonas sp. SUN039]UVO54736.1 3-keto-5-aminohexanoate cleavage protein [Sphingomonas sp. SUN039]